MIQLKDFFKRLLFCLLIILFLMGVDSCCSKKNWPHYSISPYEKSWIEYAGTSIQFKSDSGEIIPFEYTGAVYLQAEDSYGEECGDYYFIENAFFDLTSSDNSLTFGFSLSTDNFDVKTEGQSIYFFNFSEDTIFNNSTAIFVDQLILNGKAFQNVYQADLSQNSFSALSDCYLTKEEGIVGFKTKDGKTWALQ